MQFFWIILAVIFFFLIILFLPVKIEIQYQSRVGGKISVKFLFFNFTVWDSNKKSTGQETSKDEPNKKLGDFKETASIFINILSSFEKKIVIHLFSLDITAGTGDAASTGIFTGSAYAVIYNILGHLDRFFKLKKHHVNVIPEFNAPCFDIDFKGIFSLRIIYALISLFKVLPILKSA